MSRSSCTPAAAPAGRSACRWRTRTCRSRRGNVARSYALTARRRVAVRDAAVPRPRAGGLDAGHARDRRHRRRAGEVQPAVVLADRRGITASRGTRRCRRIHQLLLARAEPDAAASRRAPRSLRFIRSCSASLPPQVMHDARSGVRRAGARSLRHDRGGASDGVQSAAAGRRASRDRSDRGTDVRISIMDEDGQASAAGRARRGRHPGPERHHAATRTIPEANATSFVDGWFRTGDQGFLDDERLPDARRPHQGADQSRRREDLAARDRRSAARASGGRRSGLLRRAAPDVGRRSRGGRRRCASAATEADLLAYCKRAPGRLQAAEADSHHRRHSAHRHRQDSARRRRARRSRSTGVVKIVIAGAGAIGGYIGARLAQGRRRRRAVRARSAPAGDAGARAARDQPGRRLRGQAAGHRRPRDDRHGRRRLPRRQGARPDRARAAAAAAVRSGHRRRQHAERHPVVVLPGLSAASSTGCVSSASIRAASSPPRSSRAASSDRWPTSRPTSSSRASSVTPKATGSASASRTARKSERAAADRRGADRRRLPLPGHDAVPPRDLGEAARQRRVQPDQRADRRHARGAGAPSGRLAASCARSWPRPKRSRRSSASSCRSRSTSGWPAPKKSARTRRRCCRISKPAGRWSSKPSSAPSSSWAIGSACRCRRRARCTRARRCWTSRTRATQAATDRAGGVR